MWPLDVQWCVISKKKEMYFCFFCDISKYYSNFLAIFERFSKCSFFHDSFPAMFGFCTVLGVIDMALLGKSFLVAVGGSARGGLPREVMEMLLAAGSMCPFEETRWRVQSPQTRSANLMSHRWRAADWQQKSEQCAAVWHSIQLVW